jgi:hypothetical protein
MKRFVIITCSVMAFLVFCSKSCETPENKATMNEEIAFKATLDSITSSFVTDHLSEQTLRSLEVKAEQKLADLADYLQIYTDKSLDKSFRDHARQMIRDLFISDSVMIFLLVTPGISEECISLKDFLRSSTGLPGKSLKFTFDSLILTKPLRRINEICYTGNMSFLQRYQMPCSSNPEVSYSVKKEVEIIAKKVTKAFGSDTLKIWSVLLGDIK